MCWSSRAPATLCRRKYKEMRELLRHPLPAKPPPAWPAAPHRTIWDGQLFCRSNSNPAKRIEPTVCKAGKRIEPTVPKPAKPIEPTVTMAQRMPPARWSSTDQ
jgi:hypothetical protein